jgi:RNA polymerase sigma-70 factor (ECF subfamily)
MEDRMSVLNGASSDSRDLNSPDELEYERGLVADASQGDQRAIGALYDRYVSSLYRFCLSKSGNETDAEDLTEDIFLKAITSLDKFTWRSKKSGAESFSPFRAWLFRIARNQIISMYRKRDTRSRVDVRFEEDPIWIADKAARPDEITEKKFLLEQAAFAIEQLPDSQRDVVRLRFFGDMTVDEVARSLGKEPGNVRVLQHKALKNLRSILASEFDLLGAESQR